MRRLDSPEAKAAINESVRRIRTIALVHETLSREPGDDVTFSEIVRPLLRLVEDSLQSPDRPVSFVVHGDGGRVPATVATPLSVVLTELLQNAVDHGFREGLTGKGSVAVQLSHEVDDDDHVVLCVRVIDNGAGLATDFDIANATGLGLSIVRTLVTDRTRWHNRNASCHARRSRGRRCDSWSVCQWRRTGHCHRTPRSPLPGLRGGSAGVLCRAVAGSDLTAQGAALIFRCAAPDTRILVGVNRELQTLDLHGALTASFLCLAELQEGLAVEPTGKNNSGSVSRHTACWRHV